MLKRKTKHNSPIIDENISPLFLSNKQVTQCDFKKKLFAVSNIDNRPVLSNKPKSNKPAQKPFKAEKESKDGHSISIIPSISKKNDIPIVEHILDFDHIMEILFHNRDQKINDIPGPIKKCSQKNKTFLKRKTAKSIKIKNHTKKSKSKLKTKDLYDINNFFSSTLKIVEKKEYITINCPSFKEYLNETNEEKNIAMNYNNDMCIDENDEKKEDITDEYYKQFHDIFEKREREYLMKIHEEYNKKQRKNNVFEENRNSLIVKITFNF